MRNSVRTFLVAALATALLAPLSASGVSRLGPSGPRPSTNDVLERYAADTWRSVRAMVVPRTGLPADNVGGDLTAASRAAYTSPTNIGAYLWSTVAARDVGLIGKR